MWLKWFSSVLSATLDIEIGHSNLAATVAIRGYLDALCLGAIPCMFVSEFTSRGTDLVLPFRKERRDEVHRHLASQHGVEDPKRFVLERDSSFATFSPPRTGTRELPVEVNPAMFEQVLNASLARRQAVQASMEARHLSLQPTASGRSQTDSVAAEPSVSYASHKYPALPFPRGFLGQRSDPPIASGRRSSLDLSSSGIYTHYGMDETVVPTSHVSVGPTTPAAVPTSPSTSSPFTSSPTSAPERWAVLDGSGGYIYITPEQFEEYCRRP